MDTIKWKIPHTYALIFVLTIIMAVLTWIIPSGQFDKAEQNFTGGITRSVVVPGTYHEVPKIDEKGNDVRQGLFETLMAPTKGVQNAIQVIAYVFLIGGVFSIIMKTGAIDTGLSAAVKNLQGREKIIIPFMIILIALGGSVIGISEETLPLYMIFVPLMLALGYDSLTAVMMIYLSSQVGYVGATLNPFSVLIAQGIAGIQGNPQFLFRCIQFVVYLLVTISFVMMYARKIKKDPTKSLMYKEDLANREFFLSNANTLENVKITARQKTVLAIFAIGLVIVVWGLLKKEWYMDELAGVFLGIGVFAGIAGGLKTDEMAEAFVEGCKDFAYAAIIIGLARGILIVAESGMIMDTILNYLVNMIGSLPRPVFTTLLLLVQNFIAVLVPSSSGQAALTMPLMAPMGDLLNINKEAIVIAYQAGNGITNIISPTGGVLMAALGIAKISWNTWVKAVIKLVVILEVLAAVFCAISVTLPM